MKSTQAIEYIQYVKRFGAKDRCLYRAQIIENLSFGGWDISHSHAFRPTPNAGFNYSDSESWAEDLHEAIQVCRDYAGNLSTAPEIKQWFVFGET